MHNDREIGGYLGLECKRKNLYHKNGIFLNSARNALRHIVRVYAIKKMHVPSYTCPVVFETLKAENCKISLYEIDENFFPIFSSIDRNEFILYNNWFGICGKNVNKLVKIYPKLIIDNAQSFYSYPKGLASFYSPRKFFGVPDGGILFCCQVANWEYDVDVSYDRCMHLLKRLDVGAGAGYSDFIENEELLKNQPIRKMSNLTKNLLENIDYEDAKRCRLDNFRYLDAHLNNELALDLAEDDVPMVYPYLTKDAGLRDKLIKDGIFVAKYWPGLSGSARWVDYLLPLPIDHRYDVEDMNTILQMIRKND